MGKRFQSMNGSVVSQSLIEPRHDERTRIDDAARILADIAGAPLGCGRVTRGFGTFGSLLGDVGQRVAILQGVDGWAERVDHRVVADLGAPEILDLCERMRGPLADCGLDVVGLGERMGQLTKEHAEDDAGCPAGADEIRRADRAENLAVGTAHGEAEVRQRGFHVGTEIAVARFLVELGQVVDRLLDVPDETCQPFVLGPVVRGIRRLGKCGVAQWGGSP